LVIELPAMKDVTAIPKGRARLLSFDGGGIRGLFALQYAKRIETLLREKTGKPDLVLSDHFHYIGGTSTGAIIAAFLSWGLSADQIEKMYCENAMAMFRKAGWPQRFINNKFVSEGLTGFLKKFFVEDDGTPALFGTKKLKTLLLVVARNASTGSAWPLSNNPKAKYNDIKMAGNNLQLPLWQLVRASTAAPTFFPPEILKIKGENGEKFEYAFEDGGVTSFNNPAYLMKQMATLPEYRLAWPQGSKRMSLVSIGTGRTSLRRDQHKLDLLQQAKLIPGNLIAGMQQYQDLLCRAHGECRYGEVLDSEVGHMIRPSEKAEFLYARYDKFFNDADIQEAEEVSKKGFTLDNLELMGFLCDKGAAHAEKIVKLEHFDDE
jgi:uncharacterized protein